MKATAQGTGSATLTPAKRLLAICTLGAFAGIVLIPIHPVNSMIRNLAFLTCIMSAWSGLVILLWNRKPWRFTLAMLPSAAILVLLLPGSEIDRAELRQNYVRSMSTFEGAKYHWGGENARGIDCSGLPRKSLRDALLSYGMRHANAKALRHALELWWFDASAKALGHGYRNYTVPLGEQGTIRDMKYDHLLAGDLAVTICGRHVLAYSGNGRWIQADPGIGAVATLDGRTADNSWFRAPVTMHRWHLLAGTPPE